MTITFEATYENGTLKTNAATIRAFLNRPIVIDEPDEPGQPGRVVVG